MLLMVNPPPRSIRRLPVDGICGYLHDVTEPAVVMCRCCWRVVLPVELQDALGRSALMFAAGNGAAAACQVQQQSCVHGIVMQRGQSDASSPMTDLVHPAVHLLFACVCMCKCAHGLLWAGACCLLSALC